MFSRKFAVTFQQCIRQKYVFVWIYTMLNFSERSNFAFLLESLSIAIEKNCTIIRFLSILSRNNNHMIIRKQLLLTLLFIFTNALLHSNVAIAAAASPAPHPKAQESIFDALVREEVLEITIATDLKALVEDRRTDDYLEAMLTFADEQERQMVFPVELQWRGKFRRRVCDFPPVKLKFPKKELEARGLNKTFNDLKLVTHCIDDKTEGNENLLREYLAYQLYQTLTPHSYRVQLVKITYEDAKGNTASIKRYGFLIEDTDEMAARLGGVELEQMNTSPDSILVKDEHIMALFQYMIGNADWSTMMLRNVKLVKLESGYSIPVPYDFDFSGLVNASYAIPQSDIGLYSIRDRKYLGNPFEKESLREDLGYFLARKSILLSQVKAFKLLSGKARADILAYLETFFDSVEPAFANPQTDLKAFFSLKNATMEELQRLETTQKQQLFSGGEEK